MLATLEQAAKTPSELSLMHLYPIDGAPSKIGGADTAWANRDAVFRRIGTLTAFIVVVLVFLREIPAMWFLGIWFLLQLWDGGFAILHPQAGGGTAFFAHLGGFLGAFLIELAFEQFQRLAQTQMNDRVERFSFDLLSGKSGIILEQDRVTGQTIAQGNTALFDL